VGSLTERYEDLRLEETARLVRTAVLPTPLPAALEGTVLVAVDHVARGEDTRPPAPRERAPWLRPRFTAAAGVAAAAVLALVLLVGRGSPGALELETLLTSPTGGPARATIEVRKTGIGRVIAIRSDELPILPKGEYYELWFVGPGDAPGRRNRISAGTFHPDQDGRTDVRLAAAVDPVLYPVLSVTAEPGDGDPTPSGREVLRSREVPREG
jgi:Anti-sigma-K factor rskA